jgi:hypothetical protein
MVEFLDQQSKRYVLESMERKAATRRRKSATRLGVNHLQPLASRK